MSASNELMIPQDLDPGPKRAILVLLGGLGALVLFLAVWSAIGKMDIAVNGHGQVVPSSRLQQVQSLEGGILSDLLVREGQAVHAGDVLARIDNPQFDATLGESRQNYWGMQATVARLEAELRGVEPRFSPEVLKNARAQAEWEMQTWRSRLKGLQASVAAARQQSAQRQSDVSGSRSRVEAAQRNLALAREALAIETRLNEQGAGSRADLLTAQQRVASLEGELQVIRSAEPGTRAAVGESEARIAEIEARFRAEANTQRNELQTRIEALRERMTGELDKVERRELRAPMDGVVNRIAVTTIGGVLKPGETVMDLVPHNDGVVITARVRPEDIGFLSAGQMAKVRISAYDASVFGSLDGVVRRVGADALQDERKEMYFEVQIETSNWLKDKQGKPLNVLSGMTADVSIRTGERTILEYMLKPIVKVLDTSLKER